jgi:hypothetical protein
MTKENPFKRVQQARTPEEFIGASKDELLRTEQGAPAVPALQAPVPVVAPPVAPVAGVLRPDGTLAGRVPVQVNFKLTESVYWEIKTLAARIPGMSLRQFLEDAAVEKLRRMKGD